VAFFTHSAACASVGYVPALSRMHSADLVDLHGIGIFSQATSRLRRQAGCWRRPLAPAPVLTTTGAGAPAGQRYQVLWPPRHSHRGLHPRHSSVLVRARCAPSAAAHSCAAPATHGGGSRCAPVPRCAEQARPLHPDSPQVCWSAAGPPQGLRGAGHVHVSAMPSPYPHVRQAHWGCNADCMPWTARQTANTRHALQHK